MVIHKQISTERSIFGRATTWLLFAVIALQLIVMPIGQAQVQVFSELALTNSIVYLTPQYVPVILKGIKIYPQEPFKFDFIIDKGDSGYQGDELEAEVSKLVKYFLASLTIPDEDLWVNLSPYEKDRIIPKTFGETEMGRDLLAQDYILKQLTASLLYPEDEIGSEFWERVYSEAQEKFGTTDIPVETFNKIWIIPEKAVIYEEGEVAYVTNSKLKVMLEEDYLAYRQAGIAMPHQKDFKSSSLGAEQENKDEKVELSTQILREVVIPAIEKEVNEGKNFASLRQIYNSLILATWFKRNLKESMFGKLYLDQNKIKGVDVEDKEVKEKIYSKYLKAFQDGVYDYIKEEYDYTTQQIIPRKYFSGGTGLTKVGAIVENNGRVQDINAKEPVIAQINVTPEIENNSEDTSPATAMLSGEETNAYGESLWGMRHHHFHEIGNMSHALDGYRGLIYQENKELIEGNDDYKRAFDFISSINPNLQDIFKPKDGIHDNIQLYWSFEGFRASVNKNKVQMDLVLRSLRNAFEGREKGSMYQAYIDRILSTYSLFSEYLDRILDKNLKKEKTDLSFMMYHTINTVPASDSGVERLIARKSEGKVQVNQNLVDLDSKGYVLEVDNLRMTEVFANILKNANEKLVDGGWIDISSNISLSKKSLVITIKDNGGGITLENPNDVFKAFVTTKGEFGTGIGLALSKSIVQDHGGTITADNWEETNDQGEVQEKGAIFRIFLPITRVATEEKKTGTDHSMLSEELEKRGEQLYEMRHILRHELGNISGPLLSYKDLLMMDHEEFVNQDDNYVRVLDFVAGLNPRINFIFEEREAGFDRREIATEFEEFKQSVIDNRLDVLMYLSSLFGAMKNNPDFEEARDNLKRMINTYTRFYEYLNRVFDENLYKTKVNFPGIFNSAVRGVPKSASGLERLSDRESKGEVDILLSFEDLDQADVTLEVDELRFSEVLVNVLKNANEAMPQRGRLEVTSELVDSNILEIVFKDTGGGIQLDDPNAVFEEFVSTKGEYGTGVGLVLSKKIIEDHGGTITAENWKETNDGGIKVGAIFRITLPVIQNEEGSKTDRAILFDVKVADLAGGAKIYSTLSGNDFQRMLTEQKFYEVRDNNGVTSLFDTGRSWVTTDTPFATLNGRYGIMSKLIELGASTDADAEPIVVVDWGTGDAVGVIGLARELGDQGIRNVKIIAFANQIPVNWHNVQNSVTFILDTPNNFKAIYEKLMSDAGITKKIDLIYSNLGLSHYFKDGPRAEVTQHLEDLFSLLSSEGEIRTTIISGFGPVGIDSSQFRTKRVVEENYSSPEAWKAGRLFYYRISRTDYSDASMLGNEKDKIDSGAIKSFSAKDAILSAVRETVKNRYSIKGDISINPITGSFSEDVAGSIKYLFAEIANELIDNAVEAQKEDDILVKFDQVESGDVRFIVSNQGGIDWNKLINKAKKAANSGALFIDTSDGSYMAGEFYGALDGFEAVSEGDIDALTKDASGQLKLLTMGGITEEKGEGVQGGAGYGLTLVRARVKQLGGSLELDSRPDITTFTITIPKVSQVNYIEDATVDVEFDFIENSDTSMFGNEFAEEAGVLGVDEEDGEAIVQAARSLVTQVHDKLEGLTTVLISGYSSMLSKIMFEETWEHIYPEEAMPRVIALSGEVNKTLYKDQIALEIITPAWKKEDILQVALDDEGIDINDLRNYEKVLFLDEYVGSGQKLKMMRHTFTDQLSFNDIHFGFFFSQGSSNVEGEDMIVGTTDIHMSLELSSIAVELSDRTQLYERTQTARERFRKRDELESLITSFMRLGLAGESPIVESDVDGSSVGGIDLNTRNLDIETTGDGAGFEFSFDMNGYENITILGFSPVIIQIVPISNAAILIGQ